MFFIQKKKKIIREKGIELGEKKVLTKEELYLLIVILKKLLKIEVQKNSDLKREKETREKEQERLTHQLRIMRDKEMKLQLLPQVEHRKVLNINFNLQELDQKIDSVDKALTEVLEGSNMDAFMAETHSKNVDLDRNVS